MLRALWSYFSPFGLFRDASRGTLLERAAAARHNCRMRNRLPVYISRWLVGCAGALVLTAVFDTLAPHSESQLSVFVILAAINAVLAATSICAAFVLAYAWLSLSCDAARPRIPVTRR